MSTCICVHTCIYLLLIYIQCIVLPINKLHVGKMFTIYMYM